MRATLAIFKMRFQLLLNYRMAAIAGLFTQLFFGFVMIEVYHAFFQNTGGIDTPMTLVQTTTYVWLGQGLLALLPWNGDREIRAMIKNGDFAYELVRPLSIYWYWFIRILAQRIAPVLMKGTSLFLIVILVGKGTYGLQPPVSIEGFILFFLILSTGVILGAAISNIITISILFTIGDGIERFLPAVITIFSGMVIPLALFPDNIQWLLRILPFSGLVDAPYRFYLGLYSINDFIPILSIQIIWIALLFGLGHLMLKKAQKRVIVQGG